MKYLLLVAAVAMLSGCEQPRNPGEQLTYERPNSAAQDYCIRSHLNAMSESDNVQKWSTDLYQSVANECRRLWGKE